MGLVKVSAVSYANTLPFVYGLRHSPVSGLIDLSLDVPAVCADKLLSGRVDVGLIPVVEALKLPGYKIISDYCIGANGNVRTVALVSNVPLNEITTIYLDFQSRTSVQLVRILANQYWQIAPEFVPAEKGFEDDISGTTAAVIIGDRVFSREKRHPYVYDLSAEWKKYTGLPFVFAAWISRTVLPHDFLQVFNASLKFGLNHLKEAISSLERNELTMDVDLMTYLKKNIDFDLDQTKRTALDYFLSMVKETSPLMP